MKDIMLTCTKGVIGKLTQRSSMFELLGFDFMVDENMKVFYVFLFSKLFCERKKNYNLLSLPSSTMLQPESKLSLIHI